MIDLRLDRIVIIPIGLIMFALSGCGGRDQPPGQVVTYEQADVLAYLRAHGHAVQEVSDGWQNSDGKKLYFQEPNAPPRPSSVWVINGHTGGISKVGRPPGFGWIDEGDRFRALPSYARTGDGSWTVVDPQSGFFCQTDAALTTIHVSHVERQEGWLFTGSTGTSSFVPDRICAVGEAIILAQGKDGNQSTWTDRSKNLWICRLGDRGPGDWQVEKRRLNARIVCADSANGTLLCSSYGMLPWGSSLLLYRINDAKTRQVGRPRPDCYHFLLKEDILGTSDRSE